jgi:hypothetical protein
VTDKPAAVPAEFCARLQVLTLGDSYALIFDQWEGPALPPDMTRGIKTETGAKAVLFFRGTIDIEC